MKIKTIVTLGVGYALGAKLGPQQIEELLRSVLSPDGPKPEAVDINDARWPDAGFKL